MADVSLDSLPTPPKDLGIEDLPAPPAAQASGSLLDEIKRQVGLAGRGIVNGVTALPLMAMDAGVGTRNLVTNLSRGIYPKLNDFNPLPNTGPKSPTDYELPSATFNRSLTQAGVPEPQTTGDKAAQMLVSGMTAGRLPAPQAATQAPANFLNGAQALKNATLQAAQKEGLVVPPSMANPTLGNRIMGGIAGKYKVQQAAQLNNQPIFNQLAARALGQNPDAPPMPDMRRCASSGRCNRIRPSRINLMR